MVLYQLIDKEGKTIETFHSRQAAIAAKDMLGPEIQKTKPELVGSEEIKIEGTPFSVIVQPSEMVESVATVPLSQPRPKVVFIKHTESGELFRPGARAYALFEHHLTWTERKT
ncbi:MAG: hypothetical protein CMB80_07975 [Flammeovirgaceae bacterium]|nr:hypothetical protein [Flammeovirgaceae bacterium]|tara:strand:- start:7080 stop:7418 length:339 start_codon:yes stop_codon:yes gene_type:complete